MAVGETTKYHEAAKGIEGQRVAAGSFNDVTEGGDAGAALIAADTPNVFGNISDHDTQNEANLMAQSQAAAGAALSFGSNAIAQQLGSEAQKAEKSEKDRKSFQEQAFQSLLLQIRDLDRKIAWHEGQIKELTKQRTALDEYLAKLRRGEKPETNARVEAAIQAYEQDTGKTVDRTDAAQMVDVRTHTDGTIQRHSRDKDKLEREREGHIDEMRRTHPEEAARLFGETYEKDGRDAAEVSLSHAEDEVQTKVVEAQEFDELTEADTMEAAETLEAADFFASGDDSTIQLGTRKQGELTGQFAIAGSEVSEQSVSHEAPEIVTERPLVLSQQLDV